MSAVADKLREARALIERGWCQGHYAVSANGVSTRFSGPNAVCFCMTGATGRVDPNGAGCDLDGLLAKALGLGDGLVEEWNDAPGRTQAEVLAAFDKAIELAEAQS